MASSRKGCLQRIEVIPGLNVVILICIALIAAWPTALRGEDQVPASLEVALDHLPEAPVPQIAVADNDGGAQATDNQVEVPKTEQQKADEQINAQLHQRALGIVPMFSITYLGDQTASLTPKQKFKLAIRSSIDPVNFITPFLVAGFHMALNDQEGFDWGVEGLGQRAGAAYLDSLSGNIIGTGLLPSILHQDPRYYRIGYGSSRHRILYALATTVICKHDKTGKWEPNYSNVGGNIAAGAISTLYYPPTDEGGVGLTITNGLIVTATGAAGALFNEFWPDLSRKLFHKDPSNGLDAQHKAAHQAKTAAGNK
jgi:hypothetical protein